MEISDIKTVQDLVKMNEENEEMNEEAQRFLSLMNDVFDEGPEFGLALSQKILKSLVKMYTEGAVTLAQDGKAMAAMNATIIATKIGTAYNTLQEIEM